MHWNFPIFCHWAFIIFISKTSFPTKMETIKLNIPFLLDTLSLKALVVNVCVWSHCNLKPHTFLKMDDDIARSLNEPITTFLFLFCSREMIPCTTQGQDGIMSCQVWLRYVLHYSIFTIFYDIHWKNFIKFIYMCITLNKCWK